jgi:hypothetical protein
MSPCVSSRRRIRNPNTRRPNDGQERQTKDQRRSRLRDDLLARLDEADREKLAFAIRQTVKRITLRRERRRSDRHRVTLWDGVIELREDLGVVDVIPLTDEDISGPGRWRDAVAYIRERGRSRVRAGGRGRLGYS